MLSRSLPIACLLLCAFLSSTAAETPFYRPGTAEPPEPMREFRGVWIATVHNVDWPSRSELSPAAQQAELIEILDRCHELKLNAVVLQVRSECDALYRSEIEPWSPSLSGTMGKDPGYDPLEFALREARRRGIELHAWFNPFRAINSKHSRISSDHISRTNKELLSYYGDKVWLDPSQEKARTRALAVIEDVVSRYDVDAVHLDDYFYPYPVKAGSSYKDFDDYSSWKAYQASGGKLARADWRRKAVNDFVESLHARVRQIAPQCKLGISPFGIYRPGFPAQVKTSLDSYDQIYTDVRLWWHQGWVDYLAPQLYWSTDNPQYGFSGLFEWWRDENLQNRHLWPGIAIYRIKTEKRSAYDSLAQVRITRGDNTPTGSCGHLLFSMKSIMENYSNVNGVLQKNAYAERALVPESPWLRCEGQLAQPTLRVVTRTPGSLILDWKPGPDSLPARWWLLQSRSGETWSTQAVLPGDATSHLLPDFPEAVALRPVGPAGELGPAFVLER